ncbi:MAG: thioredoxin [Saccharospirillum sp.]|nr:thioredoxin [Saccharospirillum sp.]
MSEKANIITVTEQNFHQIMVEESQQRLVVMDFWAEWCAPCKVLMPILEKLADEYKGQFLLAKVNADEQQNIVAQFGVRSLPTVALIQDGQPVDAFMGAEPESAIRERLEKYLPKPWDSLLQQAQALHAQGDLEGALPLLREAYTLSDEQTDIAFALADVYISLNRPTDAEAILDKMTMTQQTEPEYKALRSRLELLHEASETPEIQELQQRLESNPDDLELHYELALQYSQVNRREEALDSLLTILTKDRGFKDGGAKKTFLDIINSLGKGDPVAAKYQRKLFTLLY